LPDERKNPPHNHEPWWRAVDQRRRHGSLAPVAQRFIATLHAVADEMRSAGL
jgi:hypothetical protein